LQGIIVFKTKTQMTVKYLSILAFFTLSFSFTVDAQQYGHMNFGTLIASLPETEAADSELQAYQKQLTAEVETKSEAWQKKAQEFFVKVEGGQLAPVQQQEEQANLEKERNEILALQQGITTKVQEKRKELLSPIIEKVEAAINEVAKENKYTMIFDTSVFNAILYATDSDDVTALVKAKLQG
jgi:outer membrane protein